MKSLRAGIPAFALALAAVLPSSAWAKEVAVAPFIAKGGLDPLIALNITSLVSSELDFASEYDGAVQLEEKPAGLSVACLSQAACLKKIGAATGKEHLVAGSVAPSGDEYELYMVLFNTSGGSYVRKKSFKVATTPEKMADSMTGVVSELITGKASAVEAQEAAVTDDFDMFEDDFEDFDFNDDDPVNTTIALPGSGTASLDDFEDGPDDWELEERRLEEERRDEEADRRRADEERRAAEEEASRRAADERRRAEEERRRREEAERERAEEDRRRREEAERQRAEDERRRREEDEARRRAEEERRSASTAVEDDFDDITFGDASDEIEVEIDDIVFGDATDDIVAEDYVDDDYGYREYDSYDRESSSASRSTRSGDDDDYGYGSTRERDSSSSSRSSRSRDYDLDEDDDSSSRSRSSSSSSRSGSSASIETGRNDPRMGLALRGGYSHFQALNFVTYGGGLKIPVADAAFIDVGLAGLSTRRTVEVGEQAKATICAQNPEDVRCTGEPVWNSIANFSLGLTYQNTSRDVRPYIGGDLTLTPYTRSFNTALGLQARGGLDFMVTDSFGLNLNGELGFWYGKQFPTIQEGMNHIGLVPSLTAGTVILF
jgi:hypothetical protein